MKRVAESTPSIPANFFGNLLQNDGELHAVNSLSYVRLRRRQDYQNKWLRANHRTGIFPNICNPSES